jgi:hypothetical protein
MTIAVGYLVTSAAGSAHPAILLRHRPADSRPAACRIILIRDSGADGAMSGRAFTADLIGMALGDAINLLLHRAGVGVDVDGDRFRHRGILSNGLDLDILSVPNLFR